VFRKLLSPIPSRKLLLSLGIAATLVCGLSERSLAQDLLSLPGIPRTPSATQLGLGTTPHYSAPPLGPYAPPRYSGPVTGYGPGGMGHEPGTPINPPYR
jgi:hypothetical protein